jgi:hypothetical protein
MTTDLAAAKADLAALPACVADNEDTAKPALNSRAPQDFHQTRQGKQFKRVRRHLKKLGAIQKTKERPDRKQLEHAQREILAPLPAPGMSEAICDTVTAQKRKAAPSAALLRKKTSRGKATAGPELLTRRLIDIPRAELEWLWPGKIPLGKFTMLSGDPSLGKSFVTLDIAARFSRGRGFPGSDASGITGSTIILNAEDDAADTIRPRMEAMGADLARIIIMDAIRSAGKEKHFDLATDLAALEAVLRKTPEVRLLIIDPISAYMGKTNSHNNSDVRAVLSPFTKMIARLRVAVIGISHHNKSAGGKAVYKSNGSIAFNAAARAAWAVQKDPANPDRRLFLPVKTNLATEPTGHAYRLRSVSTFAAVVEWESEAVTMTADDALAAESAPREHKSEVAAKWLNRQLQNGPVAVSELKEECKKAGFSWHTIERAKDAVGVEVEKTGFKGHWQWKL